MSTHNIMFSWGNKKNIYSIPALIWSYEIYILFPVKSLSMWSRRDRLAQEQAELTRQHQQMLSLLVSINKE